MDQSRAPLLEALEAYHRENRYGFTPPAHRQGRGVDERTRSAIGADAFASDLLASGGLDDRRMTGGYLSDAESLMAEAVGAEMAFFSTADVCHEFGKPLIVDEAWGAHLPFHDELPTWAMDAGADVCVVSVHKMGAGFEQGSVFHVQGDLVDRTRLGDCADLLMTTSPNVLLYAALDGWRRHMVQSGTRILGEALELARYVRHAVDEIGGLKVLHDELLHEEASHDLDEMQVLIDVAGLGVSGYQCADWLRDHQRIDVGLSDHRRILATLSFADDEDTAARLLAALSEMATAAAGFDPPGDIRQPSPDELQLENTMLPRDAFFGDTEFVSLADAPGRIAAEQITPYPPGIPVVVPGEVLNDAVVEYLRTGKNSGMNLPDADDDAFDSIKVVR